MTIEGRNTRRRRSPEETMFAKMPQFLRVQGRLDGTAKSELAEFIASYPGQLTSDWSEIVESLERTNASDLAARLKSKLQSPITATIKALNELGPRPDEPWAILVGAGGSKPAPSE